MFTGRDPEPERRRLPALAILFRRMNTEVRTGDIDALAPHRVEKLRLHSFHFGRRNEATPHTRLIADYDQLPSVIRQGPQRASGAGQKLHEFRIAQITPIHDHSTVTIEEERPRQHAASIRRSNS